MGDDDLGVLVLARAFAVIAASRRLTREQVEDVRRRLLRAPTDRDLVTIAAIRATLLAIPDVRTRLDEASGWVFDDARTRAETLARFTETLDAAAILGQGVTEIVSSFGDLRPVANADAIRAWWSSDESDGARGILDAAFEVALDVMGGDA